ncbi:MAG: phosphoglucosamine mutase, partial [Candidatus Omnitrophota bacterium]
MRSLFGTDGIRAKVGEYPLTDEMILKIGRALANFVKADVPESEVRKTIIIARDTRGSGEKIEGFLVEAIVSQGVNVIKLGILPTPASAFLVKKLKADLSVVISASHNSITDNGLKFFTSKGYKLSPQEESIIENLVASDDSKDLSIPDKGEVFEEEKAVSLYVSFLKKVLKGVDISPFKIVADCGYGSVSPIIGPLAEALGLNIISINDTPDGMNINKDAGSLHPKILSEKVIGESADCGFAFDGDGDRLILSDGKGNILDGDFILAIMGRYLNRKNKLNRSTIVTTYMSNLGFDMSVNLWAGKVIKVDVGDKYVLEKMVHSRLNLGGEQSGHIILLDYSTTGDALIAALFLLRIMAEEKKSLKVLSRCMYK